jgi:flavin-dependent thymidylate synthase
MRIIEPKVEELEQIDLFKHIEVCGKTCYKSTDTIKEGTAKKFVEKIMNNKHGSVLEHGTVYMTVPFSDRKKPANLNKLLGNEYTKVKYSDNMYITTNYRVIVENDFFNLMERYQTKPTENHYKRRTFRLTCNRGVSHEFVRHRVMSFSQESQRYVNYAKDKFGKEIKVIKPLYFEKGSRAYKIWERSCKRAEKDYMKLLKLGATPQEAREVLKNSTATELIMTGFESQWEDFFALRCHKTAHPQAIEISTMIKNIF